MPTRRQVLAFGAGATALAAFGGYRRFLVAPKPSGTTASVDELAQELAAALRAAGADDAFVPYDHPLRQYHNRGVWVGGPIVSLLPLAARQAVVDLVHASLRPRGLERLTSQFFNDWLSLQSARVLCCGDPADGPYQIQLSGAHMNLRLGGKSREGVAFGGPIVWGDQRGNEVVGLPGNAYRDQLALGQALFAGLTPAARQVARQAKAPVQTAIEVQGAAGRFAGVPVAELDVAGRERARAFLASILEGYAEADAAYAWECIERNGGIEAFHAADYDVDHQGGRNAAGGASQIFRLESPAAVFHWRGEPHLHALLNVAMDGEQPLSVGEVVATNPEAKDAEGVRTLFENAMATAMGTEWAFYPDVSVAGRLRAGPVRTGDLYTLESWNSRIAVLEARADALPPALRAAFAAQGRSLSDDTMLRLATIDYVAGNGEEFGFRGGRHVEDGPPLRETLIEHVRRHGLG